MHKGKVQLPTNWGLKRDEGGTRRWSILGVYGNLHLHFEIQVNKPCVNHFSHSIGVMISAQLIAALCSTCDQRTPYALKLGGPH